MKKCVKCGKEVDDSLRACPDCDGTSFEWEVVQTQKTNSIFKTKFEKIMKNLRQLLSEPRTVLILAGALIIFILAAVFFSFEVKLFADQPSVVKTCILMQWIWIVLSIFVGVLLCAGIILCIRGKNNKK